MGVDHFERLLSSVAIPLIPTHICFDGQQYYLEAIILGDYAIEATIASSRAAESVRLKQDPLVKVGFRGASERLTEKVSIAESRQISHESSNPIAIDAHSLDSIQIDINYNRGNQ